MSRLPSRLIDMVDQGSSPIILVGAGGSGKTTLIRALASRSMREGRTSLIIDAPSVSGDTDIVSTVLDQLRDQGISPQKTINIASSADLASRSLVELLNALPKPPLVIFDDILEDERSAAIRIAAGEIIRETRCTLMLAGRVKPTWVDDESRRYYEILVAPFSESEISEFVKKRNLDGGLVENLPEVSAISSGIPLVLEMLSHAFEDGLTDLSKVRDQVDPRSIFWRLFERELLQLNEAGTSSANAKAFASILAKLSIVEKVPISEISEWNTELQRISNLSMFVTRSNGYIGLAHRSLAEAIHQGLGLVPESRVSITELSFGMEEAERDTLLPEIFQVPLGLDRILSGDTTIVVGDRGAGKSALFSHLLNNDFPEAGAVDVVAVRDPSTWIEKLGTEGRSLQSAEEFRAAWRLSAAITIAENRRICGSLYDGDVAKALRETFADAREENIGFVSKLYSFLKPSKFKFSLGPVSLEASGMPSQGRRAKDLAIDRFLAEVDDKLSDSGRRIILAIDRVDEIHKYDRTTQEKLVQGLFQCESATAEFNRISLLIFIRSDLFHVYSIEEKNKLVSRRLDLTWDDSRLLGLLLSRVFADPVLQPLRERTFSDFGGTRFGLRAAFPETVEGVPFQDWLWSFLRNGNGKISPRQIVLLLLLSKDAKEAKETFVNDLPIFTSSVLRQAADKLSEISFEEMLDDFRVAPGFLRNCRADKVESLDTQDVDALFPKDDGDRHQKIDHLERLGFLERAVRQDREGKKTSYFIIPRLFTRAWIASPTRKKTVPVHDPSSDSGSELQ